MASPPRVFRINEVKQKMDGWNRDAADTGLTQIELYRSMMLDTLLALLLMMYVTPDEVTVTVHRSKGHRGKMGAP